MRQKALIETIEIEEINAKLVHDAGFPDFYKKYLNADLENPELREEILDYFIDKIYVDDDGNLSFVIKRYGKDGTKLVEMSADELIENQGFTRFDNFTLCSTRKPCRTLSARFLSFIFGLIKVCRSCKVALWKPAYKTPNSTVQPCNRL